MKTNRKAENLLLSIALFAVSGAILAYNLLSHEDSTVTVSLSELVSYEPRTASAISEYTAANLAYSDSVAVFTEPSAPPRSYELLPPIVTPPR